ncbi:hypothetical protein F4777DRAFT_585338 [Nemania sp. FL0916]|nr:hypothetical protein F4777DRAFT_585338 [Nemania sp. FL0916]
MANQSNRTCWQDGSLEMTRGQLQEEMKRQDRELGTLYVERARMRTSRNELAAREVDAEMWNKLSRIREPSGATRTMKNPRDDNQQERWRRELFNSYGARGPNGTAWCPVHGGWVHTEFITAAHIVRYNVTVVPTMDGNDLMVVVLDETEREEELNSPLIFRKGKALHGRILKFQTPQRPSMRYLYFAFVINILRRQRFEVDGWWKDRLEYANTPFFASPGKWICQSTLRKLAVRVGYLRLLPPIYDADKFASTTCGGSAIRRSPFQSRGALEHDDDDDDEDSDSSPASSVSDESGSDWEIPRDYIYQT